MPENPSLDPRGIRVVDLRDLPWNFGPAVKRPADASLVKPGSAWLETDTGNGFYSDGVDWRPVSGAGAALGWEDVGTDTPGAGGLQFDTYPQQGEWFVAEVTTRTGSPYGRAFEINDKSVGGSSGIEIRSSESEIDIDAGGNLALSSGGRFLFLVNTDWTAQVNSNLTFTVLGNATWDLANNLDVLFRVANQRFSIYGAGPVMKVRMFGDGRVAMPALPTVAGAAGELWVDGSGFVRRA